MRNTILLIAAAAGVAHAHMSPYHPSMYGVGEYFDSSEAGDPFAPLGPFWDQDSWWFRGPTARSLKPADRTYPSGVLDVPAGGTITLEIACHVAWTSYGWATTEPGSALDACPGNVGAFHSGDPNADTIDDSLLSGCALAIADKENIEDVGWDDLVVFSVQEQCVKQKHTDFQVPAKMPKCTGSKCICGWFWLANNGTTNYYMTAFDCAVSGSPEDALPIAAPQDPVFCADWSGADCVSGAKRPLYAYNYPYNVPFISNDWRAGYHEDWSFHNGAQNDIFVTANTSIAQNTTTASASAPSSTMAVSGTLASSSSLVASSTVLSSAPASSSVVTSSGLSFSASPSSAHVSASANSTLAPSSSVQASSIHASSSALSASSVAASGASSANASSGVSSQASSTPSSVASHASSTASSLPSSSSSAASHSASASASSSSGSLAASSHAASSISSSASASSVSAASSSASSSASTTTKIASTRRPAAASVASATPLVNLARQATAAASSYWGASPPSSAIDGVISGNLVSGGNAGAEWASRGGLVGSWIRLTWTKAVSFNQIVLYDRPNTNDQITSGTVTFSDGTSISFGELENTAKTASFLNLTSTISTTTLTIRVTGVSSTTHDVGLSEVEVYLADATKFGASGLKPRSLRARHARDFSSSREAQSPEPTSSVADNATVAEVADSIAQAAIEAPIGLAADSLFGDSDSLETVLQDEE